MRTGVMELAALSLFAVIGLVTLVPGVRGVWRGHASRGWPTVPGRVVRSATETTVSTDRDTRRTTATHAARIAVQYTVAGRAYETETLRFGQTAGSSDPSEAALLRLRYPRGSAVTVAYDPSAPAIAAVEPGLHAEAFWLPGAGLAFVAAGVVFVALYRDSQSAGGGFATGLTLFALVFCGIGLALVAPGAIALWRASASAAWPATAGTIVMGRDTLGSTLPDGRLVYAYDVAGRRYYGNRRRFGQVGSPSGSDAAEAVAARYPRGRAVPVRYDPRRPDLAVLEPGVSTEAYLLPGAGLAFLLFGAAALRWGVPALAG